MKLRTKVKRLKEENERLKKMPMEPRKLVVTPHKIVTLRAASMVDTSRCTEDWQQYVSKSMVYDELFKKVKDYVTENKRRFMHDPDIVEFMVELNVVIPEDQV